MSVPWNKTAYQYASELEDENARLRAKIKKLEEEAEWKQSSRRAAMASKYGGEDW